VLIICTGDYDFIKDYINWGWNYESNSRWNWQ
jgi:hypothetical protein